MVKFKKLSIPRKNAGLGAATNNQGEIDMEIKDAIGKVVQSQHLSEEEAFASAQNIMQGNATDAQIAALLVGLRLKGETQEEITGFVRAMRAEATPVPCKRDRLVDTCGTGGDKSGTFNVSTVSALVAAGAGCVVAKHGNRSVSSQCGSADLFAQLGVKIDAPPETMGLCIDENGIGFLFAPSLHKAMKYAAGPRKEIGVRTIFNILGPLTNPAGAKRQLIGVFDGALTETLAGVLNKLGSEHVLVVHGEEGLDEITLTGSTKVAELKNGEVKTYGIQPEDFGFNRVPLAALKGGGPATNAAIALDVLKGKKGAARDMVLLNAGAVAYVAGMAGSIREGIRMAAESIDSGRAMEKLEGLKRMTQEA
jgi:anthranilate phosphoribosyltransferase